MAIRNLARNRGGVPPDDAPQLWRVWGGGYAPEGTGGPAGWSFIVTGPDGTRLEGCGPIEAGASAAAMRGLLNGIAKTPPGATVRVRCSDARVLKALTDIALPTHSEVLALAETRVIRPKPWAGPVRIVPLAKRANAAALIGAGLRGRMDWPALTGDECFRADSAGMWYNKTSAPS